MLRPPDFAYLMSGGSTPQLCYLGGPGAATRLQQPALGGPAGELVAAGELELAQHRRHVGLHRLGRDRQLAGDLLVGVAAGDEAQDLALSGGELVELGVERGGGAAGAILA